MLLVKIIIEAATFCFILNLMVMGKKVTQIDPRIVSGTLCPIQEHPYFVTILNQQLCGGSLITLQWILTAGHCVQNQPLNITNVRAGFDKDMNAKTVQRRKAKKVVIHKKFNLKKISIRKTEVRYDIALVLVTEPFSKTKAVDVVTLPQPGFTDKCKIGTSMGVGLDYTIYYARSVVASKPLKCVDLSIVDRWECRRTWPTSVVDDTIVCAMEERSNRDTCSGDSGGPLVCKGVLIGIVSVGKGCGTPKMASSYTKVESYLDFIAEQVEKKDLIFMKHRSLPTADNVGSTARLPFFLAFTLTFCFLL